MTVARINRISEFEGQIVQLNGWVYNSRRSGKIGFLMFRDGFGIIQCIVAKMMWARINLKYSKA